MYPPSMVTPLMGVRAAYKEACMGKVTRLASSDENDRVFCTRKSMPAVSMPSRYELDSSRSYSHFTAEFSREISPTS